MHNRCRSLIALLCALAAPLAGAAGPRATLNLDPDWRFLRAGVTEPADDSSWQKVSLPHSFNAGDALDPATYRGPAWYRRTLTMAALAPGRRAWLEFDGAALTTEVWVNGHKAGRHEGGFARFRFDISKLLKPGANSLAVRVDNAVQRNVAPLGGDYSVYGGLYRSVRLVTTADVHLDMQDYGGPGAYFSARDITPAGATLNWTARLANARNSAASVTVVASLRDARQRIVAKASQRVTLPPGQTTAVVLNAALAKPHLWHGVDDPYLYTSEVEVAGAGTTLDRVSLPVGIRTIQIDANKGLLLNGRPYKVHGVNLHHTTLPGKGAAVADTDVDADYRIMADLGVTGLRFSHYQHQQRAYDLADQKGYLVWTELPLTSEVDAAPAFLENSVQQLREMIRQNYHHPSVYVWGLGNEIYKVDEHSARVLGRLNVLAREEDPSRPTVYANCCGAIDGPQAMHTDLIASNVYFGWYDGEFTDLSAWLDKNHALRPATPQAISEYGAGASPAHQQDPPVRPRTTDRFHPEQYQTLYHEAAWRQLASKPWLWATYVWVGIDFPSSGRKEGEQTGINDKGLVTYDRKVRKDAFYWYQANWSAQPMLYITSRRHTERTDEMADVKIYSNQREVRLLVNGVDQGARKVEDRIARWQVRLAPGPNRIEAAAAGLRDSVEWRLK